MSELAWLGDWAKRIKITIDHNDVDASLSHFPVLLYLSSSSGITGVDVTPIFDEVGANSKKIAVTKSDGTTQLYVEIEKWDSVNEKAWLWVSRSGWSISNTVDTDIYIYYDNTKADNITYVGDIESRTEVWDGAFRYVYHMRDKTTSSVADSTSNNNDGTKKGANEPIVTPSGKIDDAQDFDGADDYISNPADIPSIYTIEAWVAVDVDVDGFFHGGAANKYAALVGYSSAANKFFAVKHRSDNYIYTDAITLGTLYHITYIANNTFHEIFQNGVSKDSATTANTATTDTALFIGKRADGYYWDGIVDEIRMSTVVRSDAWIKASYESGRDDLVAYGSEETPVKKAKPASIIPLMKVLDFLQTKPFSKRFPKFKPRLVA